MKRSLTFIVLALTLFIADSPAHATDSIFASFGSFDLHVPFKTVSTTALWDFKSKMGLIGAETPLASWRRLVFTGGAITSLHGQGSPFIGFEVGLANPLENLAPLAELHPGIFGGRNFNDGEYMVGLKASTALW